MAPIHRNRRAWLAIALLVAAAAFFGPWAYDRIHVPAQYTCSLPNIRLEGDFCGVPLRGTWVITTAAQSFMSLPAAWVRGEPWISGGTPEMILAAMTFFLVLPLLTTLGQMLGAEGRRWRRVNLVAWALGLVVAGLTATAGLLNGWGLLRGWGVWLYMGLALGMVVAEARAGR